MDTNEDGLTFKAWLALVDREVSRICGFTTGDLADFPSYDSWADGLTPKDAAHVVLVEWNDYPEDLLS